MPNYDQIARLVGTPVTGNTLPDQGLSVSFSKDGNTVAIGGPLDGNSVGATWIFVNQNGTYVQQQKLVGTGNTGPSQQGQSVSLSDDGNTVAVGGPVDDFAFGATWIFTRIGKTWSQEGPKLVVSDNTGPSSLGFSVGLSGDGNTLAIGGPNNNNDKQGATWIFIKNQITGFFQQQAMLIANTGIEDSSTGISVSLTTDGNLLAVGSAGGSGNHGSAVIFSRTGIAWYQQANLVGSPIIGNDGLQGQSVSLAPDGSIVALGAPHDGFNAVSNPLGATYIFKINMNGTWSQTAKLVGTGAQPGTTGFAQGYSVSLSANKQFLAVGAPNDNNNLGATWIFQNNGGSWSQLGSKIVASGSPTVDPAQGTSVSFNSNGQLLAIGGPGIFSFASSQEGQTWIFSSSSAPCLHPDTMIITSCGIKAIKDIRGGDIIYDHEHQPVKVLFNMKCSSSKEFVRIEAGLISKNIPSSDLLIRPEHPILANGIELPAIQVVKNLKGFNSKYKLSSKVPVWSLCTKQRVFVMMQNTPVATWAEPDVSSPNFKYKFEKF